MKDTILQRLCCPVCRGSLAWQSFQDKQGEEIRDGVTWCRACGNWYPIEDGLLELLPPELAYREDKRRFWDSRRHALQELGLEAPAAPADDHSAEAQRKQQEHFDWYAGNGEQTY